MPERVDICDREIRERVAAAVFVVAPTSPISVECAITRPGASLAATVDPAQR